MSIEPSPSLEGFESKVSSIRPGKVAPFLIVAITILLYLPSVWYSFVWDDHLLISTNAQIQAIENLPKALLTGFIFMPGLAPAYYRPLTTSTFVFDFMLWQNLPPGYHLTNILLHLVVCLLVYVVALRLLRNQWAAIIAGALFAAHPTHVESVAWISGRTDLLATAFLLPSFIFYANHTSAKSGSRWLLLSALFMFFALSSKETVIAFPLVWLVYGFGVAKRKPMGLLLDTIVFAVVVGIYMALRHNVLTTQLTPVHLVAFRTRFLAAPANLLTAFRLMYLVYLGEPYHRMAFSVTIPKWQLISSWIAIILALGGYIWLWTKSRLAAFTITWAAIGVWPVLNFVQLPRPILAERFLYLGTIGSCISIGLAARYITTRWPRSIIAVGLCSVVLAGIWSVGTVVGSKVWKDDESLWRRITYVADKNEKDNASWGYERAEYYNCLSMALYNKKDNEEALDSALTAIRLDNRHAGAHMMAGLCYGVLDRPDDALIELEKAVEISPKNSQVLSNYGSQLMKVGRYEEGIKILKQTIELNGGTIDVFRNLGQAYKILGKWKESAESFERAVELLPKDITARGEYALSLQRMGRREDAIKQWEIIMHEAKGLPEAELAAKEISQLRQTPKP